MDQRVTHRWARGVFVGVVRLAAGAVLITACGGDGTAPDTHLDGTNGFWRLAVNHRAALLSTVAPYDTLRLVATPLNAKGEPLPETALRGATTEFRVGDPTDTNVTVSATGLIRARHAETGAVIRVRVAAQGIVRTDSVILNITDATPEPGSVSLSLRLDPDDTLYTLSFTHGIPALVASVSAPSGGTLTDAPVVFWSGDTSVAKVSATTGFLDNQHATKFGRVTLYASTTVFGAVRTDSVTLVTTKPFAARVYVRFVTPRASQTPVGLFDPTVDTIAVGGLVFWLDEDDDWRPTGGFYYNEQPIDVAFDTPEAAKPWDLFAQFCGVPEGGNIPPFTSDPTNVCRYLRARAFPTPGTYHYHSTLYGTKGTIVVVP